jgi:outer membrane lipoprotein LolB
VSLRAGLVPAAWLVLAVGLAGCASAPPTPTETGWISGRLSLRIEAWGKAPARSVGSSFELRGGAEAGELRLTSPLGTRLASARWAAGEAVLTTPDGERRFAGLDELSREALGEALPLAALPDWLAGRAWSGAPHRAVADGFEQLGWQVGLARLTEGWIEARREAPPAVAVRVKLDAVEP